MGTYSFLFPDTLRKRKFVREKKTAHLFLFPFSSPKKEIFMASNVDEFPSSYSDSLSHLNFSLSSRRKTRRFFHVCPLDAVKVNGAMWNNGLQSRKTRQLAGGGWFDNGEAAYVSNSQESCLLQKVGARKVKPGLVVIDIHYNKVFRVRKRGKTLTGVQE